MPAYNRVRSSTWSGGNIPLIPKGNQPLKPANTVPKGNAGGNTREHVLNRNAEPVVPRTPVLSPAQVSGPKKRAQDIMTNLRRYYQKLRAENGPIVAKLKLLENVVRTLNELRSKGKANVLTELQKIARQTSPNAGSQKISHTEKQEWIRVMNILQKAASNDDPNIELKNLDSMEKAVAWVAGLNTEAARSAILRKASSMISDAAQQQHQKAEADHTIPPLSPDQLSSLPVDIPDSSAISEASSNASTVSVVDDPPDTEGERGEQKTDD